MDKTPESHPTTRAQSRARITNACEACRAAKVKCQASSQSGICKRCLDSKRECIFKTGPRTRRPRQSRLAESAPRPPPPAGPSKTFTIDIPMPAAEDDNTLADALETLRLNHESSIDKLVPHISDGEDDPYYGYDPQDDWMDTAGSVASHAPSTASYKSLPVGASALSTPPSSVISSGAGGSKDGQSAGQQHRVGGYPTRPPRSAASLGVQPQFNLDSAAKLLDSFKNVMLDHFPCVLLGTDDTVTNLAQDKPFLLLAVLAAASSTRTLQGHSLYDEEFRKILGLKFVAGGERSIELLQGLAVYIAWYPFHLRPKNRQAFQYIRMSVDIVHDLELDQDPAVPTMLEHGVPPTPQMLEELRTYLSSYYQVSNFASVWNRTPTMPYTEYTSQCCDIIEKYAQTEGDKILAWLVRLQRLNEETSELRRARRGHSQSEYQIGMMLRGMETQLDDWERRMDPKVAAKPSIRIATLFTRTYLSGAPLLKLPSVKTEPSLDPATQFRADPARIQSAIPHLQATYEYYLSLPASEINAFSGGEWSSLILVVILGFRMSFPLTVCPEWDDRAARQQIRFGEYLDRLCRMGGTDAPQDGDELAAGLTASHNNLTPATSTGSGKQKQSPRSMDVLSASKVVFGVVRKKYQKRVAKIESRVPPSGPSTSVLQQTSQQGLGIGGLHHQAMMHDAQQQQQEQQQQQQQQQLNLMMAAATQAHPGLNLSSVTATTTSMQLDASMTGCPVMDGSLDPYFPYWDEEFPADPSSNSGKHTALQLQYQAAAAAAAGITPPIGGDGSGSSGGYMPGEGSIASSGSAREQQTPGGGAGAGGGAAPSYEDLWAAMTVGWATQQQHDLNFDGL